MILDGTVNVANHFSPPLTTYLKCCEIYRLNMTLGCML